MGILSEVLQGWQSLIDVDKMPVFLFAALLFLFLRKEQNSKETFVRYSLLFTFLVMFPPTAALLMTYQTRFYNYVYIWSFVPDAAIVAYAIDLLCNEEMPELYRKRKAGAMVLLVGLGFTIIMSSGLIYRPLDAHLVKKIPYDSSAVLSALQQENKSGLLVWAPEDVITYIGQNDASVKLLYGRNMWENQLNAYFFDTYSEELKEMHQWMELHNEEQELETSECVALAEKNGVNCIVLPEETSIYDVDMFRASFGGRQIFIGCYYIFIK